MRGKSHKFHQISKIPHLVYIEPAFFPWKPIWPSFFPSFFRSKSTIFPMTTRPIWGHWDDPMWRWVPPHTRNVEMSPLTYRLCICIYIYILYLIIYIILYIYIHYIIYNNIYIYIYIILHIIYNNIYIYIILHIIWYI